MATYSPEYLAWLDQNFPGNPPEDVGILARYQGTTGQSPTGTASAGGDLSPAGLAKVFRQPDVTLPRGEEAKGDLRDMQLEGVAGLRTLIGADPQAQRDALRKAIYDPTAADINFEADRAKQSGLETMFGKNMGASTVTGDYVIEPVERARGANLSRASNDAFVRANEIGNANATTQATLLGRAFDQGTTGLQAEANVENANASRNASTTQAGFTTGAQLGENAANRGQQESQFTRSLGQTKELQEKAFTNARDISSNNSLQAGIGGGIAGLASLFGPQGLGTSVLKSQFPSVFA